ncbi:11082_t:CDS:1 [Diversispora eburnea]|uniref:11082_t:CDS:1 n=1 Tax=Diversispora eburnea TaxID=1213867 RepID=A0A9N8VM73_9GLOM|nr:11082_t:CDS:1 [Diversispora eburnea]
MAKRIYQSLKEEQVAESSKRQRTHSEGFLIRETREIREIRESSVESIETIKDDGSEPELVEENNNIQLNNIYRNLLGHYFESENLSPPKFITVNNENGIVSFIYVENKKFHSGICFSEEAAEEMVAKQYCEWLDLNITSQNSKIIQWGVCDEIVQLQRNSYESWLKWKKTVPKNKKNKVIIESTLPPQLPETPAEFIASKKKAMRNYIEGENNDNDNLTNLSFVRRRMLERQRKKKKEKALKRKRDEATKIFLSDEAYKDAERALLERYDDKCYYDCLLKYARNTNNRFPTWFPIIYGDNQGWIVEMDYFRKFTSGVHKDYFDARNEAAKAAAKYFPSVCSGHFHQKME